jgi:hypothetical protein
MTKSLSTTPSVTFRPASSTATASRIRPKTSRSCTNYLKNMPNPKNSTSAKSSLRGNLKMLHSPAARGQGLRSQTPVGTAAISSRCTTSPTSTPLVRPLAARNIPPRAAETELADGARDVRNRRVDFTACFTAKTAPTKPKIAQRRRPPETGWHGRNQPTTLELSHTHISIPLHHTSTPPLPIHRTTHTNTTRKYKSYLPHPLFHISNNKTSTTPCPETRGLRRSAVSRSHSYDHWGSSTDFNTKRQKRDHYRSINHIAITGPVVQTKWSHVPLLGTCSQML